MLLLPAFLFSVFYMYWSLPIGCLQYRIPFLSVTSKRRRDMFGWAETLVRYFDAAFFKVGTDGLFRSEEPVIYICNHRSWADFFLDEYLTEARASPISRMAVFYVFPIFLTSASWMRSVIFFKRDRIADKEAFNARLEAAITRSFAKGLVVYIEGHRSLLPTSLPLKRGMLHFAHSRKYPVQVVITKGKEQLLCEKKLSVAFGARLPCGFAPPVHSAEYPDFEAFVDKVQQEWDRVWGEVYGSDVAALVPYEPGKALPPGASFPMSILVVQAAICTLSIALFSAVILSVKACVTFSIHTKIIGALLMGLTMLSLQRAVKPAAQLP